MSILNRVSIHCPLCRTAMAFDAVHSVNADRRPDLREAILNRSFQSKTCVSCAASFRLDPSFNYLDIGRGQWIAVQPLTERDHWAEREEAARALFAQGYGERAAATARRIGAGLRPRLVFGWSALREKIIAAACGLDDVALELLKLAMLRNLSDSPFAADVSLRLLDGLDEGQGNLVLGWVRDSTDATAERREVPRHLYQEIEADIAEPDGAWAESRDTFAGALFVDVDRIMIEPQPSAGPGR